MSRSSSERSGSGGDCTYYGCVPSKSLIDTAHAVVEARRLASDGILDVAPGLAFHAVRVRQQEVVQEIGHDERDERFISLGIALFRGSAAFLGAHELQVGDASLHADRFVIATGSEPALPPLKGLDAVPYLTCLLYTSPSPRDRTRSRMPSSA